MESVLNKTMQSLEVALRYNPTSVELMASLAEVYIRLGRFDARTMELCESVLSKQMDNLLLQQAQSIGALIEQSRAIESMIARGENPPPSDAIDSSIETLSEFLAQSSECVDAWIAWTCFQILAGRLDRATRGLTNLKQLGVSDLAKVFHYTLHHAAHRTDLEPEQVRNLAELYIGIGAPVPAMQLLERLFDAGRTDVGPTLLEHYLKRYSPSKPEEVPAAMRERLFNLMLDYGERDLIDTWLQRATRLGWEIRCYMRIYAQKLIEEEMLDEAFALLQRQTLDVHVKAMLNRLSEHYERRDEIEKAVAALRFINDHELNDSLVDERRENELARDGELSMAELQFKNGRFNHALQKYVLAQRLSPETDMAIMDRIDEIIKNATSLEIEPLLSLSDYFRERGEHPRALFYLNQATERAPNNPEALQALEALFDEILAENPDLPQLRLELGEIYLRTGRHAKAIEMFKDASASPSLAPRARLLLARTHSSAGQITEALEAYRSVRIEDDDLETLYRLHEDLAIRQSYREALVALDLIAKTNPNYRDVSEKIRLLEDRIGKLQPEVVADPRMRELIGDLAVGRYQYLDKLGSGGMGVVHKVFDIRNQQVVAMKILRDTLSGSSKALERFFREARIAATIRHRHIVNIFDYNISNVSGQSYIVMEYVDGPSLREIVDRQFQNTMSISLEYITEILYYGTQLCDALEAAHSKGIVHRDIKPDNIMINSQGEVKITDFGIVHVEAATFTPTGAMLGTPRYMSPEQVTGGKIDGRSDIYSVGILLYEVLVGSPPFMTGDVAYQQVHNTPVSPREINPLIPQGCGEMILKCLAKKPEDRYLNAHALKSEVAQYLNNLGGCNKFSNQTCVGDSTEAFNIGQDQELDLD